MFCISWESCLLQQKHGAREVLGGQRIYEQASLWQINSQTLLTHVPNLTLPLVVKNSLNNPTYPSSVLRKNEEAERLENQLCFLLVPENTFFPVDVYTVGNFLPVGLTTEV